MKRSRCENINEAGMGNCIFQSIIMSIIAKTHDLDILYDDNTVNKLKQFGIELYCGKRQFETVRSIRDDDVRDIINSYSLNTSLMLTKHYYLQSKECCKILFDYIRNSDQQRKLINNNPYKHLYKNNQSCGIHVRLGDVALFNPGSEYYLKALEKVTFSDLFIGTDSPGHPVINEICSKYKNACILNLGEINTIQYISTCKNIILSHGTYSAIIGYMAFFSDRIYCPVYDVTFKNFWSQDVLSCITNCITL